MIGWSAVAEREPHVAHATGSTFAGYYALSHTALDAVVLGHNSVGILDEVAQNVEALGPQFDIPRRQRTAGRARYQA